MRPLLAPNRKHFWLVFTKCNTPSQVASTVIFTSHSLPIEQDGPRGHYPERAHLYSFPSCHRNDTGWKSPKPILPNIKPTTKPAGPGTQLPGDANRHGRPLARRAPGPGVRPPLGARVGPAHPPAPDPAAPPGPAALRAGTARPGGGAVATATGPGGRGARACALGSGAGPGRAAWRRTRHGKGPGEGTGSGAKGRATPLVPPSSPTAAARTRGAAPVLAHPQRPCLRCDPEQGGDELLAAHSGPDV